MPTPTPVESRSLKLWPASFLLALLCVGAVIAVSWSEPGKGAAGAYQVGYYAGIAFALIVLPVLLAKVAHLVSRRSSLAANIAFLVVLLLATGGNIARGVRQSSDRHVTAKMLADARPQQAAIQREMDEKGYVDDLAGAGERNAKLLEEAGAKMSPEAGGVMKAGAAIARRLTELSVPYNDAMKALMEAGGCAPAGLHTAADVRERLAIIERVGAANEPLLKYLRGIESEAMRQMRAAGVPENQLTGSVRGFMQGVHQPLLVQIRELDVEFVAAAREHFGVLLEQEGKWTLDGEMFQVGEGFPDDAVERFTKAGEKIDQISARQAALMEELRARQAAAK